MTPPEIVAVFSLRVLLMMVRVDPMYARITPPVLALLLVNAVVSMAALLSCCMFMLPPKS